MVPTRTGLYPAERAQPAFRVPNGFRRSRDGSTAKPEERSQRLTGTQRRGHTRSDPPPAASSSTSVGGAASVAGRARDTVSRWARPLPLEDEDVDIQPLDRDVVLAPYWHALKLLGFDHVAVWRALPPEELQEAFRLCGIEKLGHQWYIINKYCGPRTTREADDAATTHPPTQRPAGASELRQARGSATGAVPPQVSSSPSTPKKGGPCDSFASPLPKHQTTATQTTRTAHADGERVVVGTDSVAAPRGEMGSGEEGSERRAAAAWSAWPHSHPVAGHSDGGDDTELPRRPSLSPEGSGTPSKRKLKLVLHHRLLTPSSASRSRSRSPKTRKQQHATTQHQRGTSPLPVHRAGPRGVKRLEVVGDGDAAEPGADRMRSSTVLTKPPSSSLNDVHYTRHHSNAAIDEVQAEVFWSALQSPPASSLHESAAYRRLQTLLSLTPRTGAGGGGGSSSGGRTVPSHRRRSTSPKRDDDGYYSAVASEWVMEAARRRFLSPHRPRMDGSGGGGSVGVAIGGVADLGEQRSALRPLSPFHIGF